MTRFFRVISVLGWPSSTGDAFADASCLSIYSEVTCAENVKMPVYDPKVDVGSLDFVIRFQHAILSRDCTRQDCDHKLFHLAVGHGHHHD